MKFIILYLIINQFASLNLQSDYESFLHSNKPVLVEKYYYLWYSPSKTGSEKVLYVSRSLRGNCVTWSDCSEMEKDSQTKFLNNLADRAKIKYFHVIVVYRDGDLEVNTSKEKTCDFYKRMGYKIITIY